MDRKRAVSELRDALHCLEQYLEYGESMRVIGRGFHPTDTIGREIETVIYSLKCTIKELTEDK